MFTSAFIPEDLSIALIYPRVMINCFNHSTTSSLVLKSGSVTISINGEPERL